MVKLHQCSPYNVLSINVFITENVGVLYWELKLVTVCLLCTKVIVCVVHLYIEVVLFRGVWHIL